MSNSSAEKKEKSNQVTLYDIPHSVAQNKRFTDPIFDLNESLHLTLLHLNVNALSLSYCPAENLNWPRLTLLVEAGKSRYKVCVSRRLTRNSELLERLSTVSNALWTEEDAEKPINIRLSTDVSLPVLKAAVDAYFCEMQCTMELDDLRQRRSLLSSALDTAEQIERITRQHILQDYNQLVRDYINRCTQREHDENLEFVYADLYDGEFEESTPINTEQFKQVERFDGSPLHFEILKREAEEWIKTKCWPESRENLLKRLHNDFCNQQPNLDEIRGLVSKLNAELKSMPARTRSLRQHYVTLMFADMLLDVEFVESHILDTTVFPNSLSTVPDQFVEPYLEAYFACFTENCYTTFAEKMFVFCTENPLLAREIWEKSNRRELLNVMQPPLKKFGRLMKMQFDQLYEEFASKEEHQSSLFQDDPLLVKLRQELNRSVGTRYYYSLKLQEEGPESSRTERCDILKNKISSRIAQLRAERQRQRATQATTRELPKFAWFDRSKKN